MDWVTVALSIVGIVIFFVYFIISAITEYCRRNNNKSLIMKLFSFFWLCFVFLVALVLGILVLIMRIVINI